MYVRERTHTYTKKKENQYAWGYSMKLPSLYGNLGIAFMQLLDTILISNAERAECNQMRGSIGFLTCEE